MMLRLISVLLILCILVVQGKSQMDAYSYNRMIIDVEPGWQEVLIPEDIFQFLNKDLSDIRIYSLHPGIDTVATPYLLHIYSDKFEKKLAPQTIINRSSADGESSFIIQTSNETVLNELELDFEKNNYDWSIRLEGSQDLSQWALLLQEYRILSIQNDVTNFKHTAVRFPDSKYTYYKITIPESPLPELNDVAIRSNKRIPGKKKAINGKYTIIQNDQLKRTEIDVDFSTTLPYHAVQLYPGVAYDFYRNIDIYALKDSTKTEKGWKQNFLKIKSGVFSSVSDGVFRFPTALTNKFRIVVYNVDNPPVSLQRIEGIHYEHSLKIRFGEGNEHFLCYGNPEARKPNYDVSRFSKTISDSLDRATLGPVIKRTITDDSQLVGKGWLQKSMWIILGLLIGTIGWFTIRMLRDEPS